MSEIVVGYDGSACGEAALDEAMRLAPPLGDESPLSSATRRRASGAARSPTTRRRSRNWARRCSARRAEQASAAGVEIGEELVPKRGLEALIEVADARDARMIVVGSFGESALKGIILGSTTNKLLHLTDRPVLVVPAKEA